jgi:glycerate 2-kinase
MRTDLKKEARQIFEAGLRAVDPNEAVKRFLIREGNTLVLGEQKLDLEDFEGIWAIGAGKA